MKRFIRFFCLLAALHSSYSLADEKPKKVSRKIVADISIPYERPIGFTINLAALASLTFEGRFLLGLAPHLSFVALPSFQKTIDLPFYDFKAKTFVDAFGITRANLGLGLRGHFYEYDSWDGFYVEGMSRFGMTWAGDDPFMWAITPSLILGYQWVYLSGYTVSFGVGIEWELLLGRPPGRHSQILKTNYWNISKIPPTAEWSIGWTW